LCGAPSIAVPAMTTDVTLPIAAPGHMAAAAMAWRSAGFTCFKVKVGRAWKSDRDALRAVHAAVPEARFRLDANEGFTAGDAIALLEDALAAGLALECFEQPCRRDDLAGMAQVASASSVPVVADESLRSIADLDAILRAGAARGVNLKLVKHGGPRAALAIGRRAQAEGLGVMAGAMVETRLGLTAMAHVVVALGGVDWLDLDTALLLATDPFEGGMRVERSHVELSGGAGLDVRVGDAR
ncbi:MAG: dipeptide epimerase, partial [Myxococcota bacterium]|nr:dipeptide epimerase [Myxococcota bacterium]